MHELQRYESCYILFCDKLHGLGLLFVCAVTVAWAKVKNFFWSLFASSLGILVDLALCSER